MVQTAHKYISVDNCFYRSTDHGVVIVEAWIAFQTAGIDGDDRYLFEPGLFQRPSNESDIVCCTTAATGLCNGKSGFVQIILAGLEFFNQLSNDQNGRVAGIVVYIFQTDIDSGLLRIRKRYEVNTAFAKGGH